MQSEAPPEQGPSVKHEQETTPSPRTKRRRQSEHSPRTTTEEPEPSALPSGSETDRTLKGSPQKRGSSRERDMQRSSTPPESSVSTIRYTRTGRVSKASKGQRVHSCDECGKTYTRAEHLRRHQQNHKPGAFPCDIPGCGRSFYREDLLLRHKARHNDPLNPPTRRPSISSQASAPGVDASNTSGAQLPPSLPGVERDADAVSDVVTQGTPATTTQQSTSSRAPTRKTYIPINELQVATAPIAANTGGSYSDHQLGGLWEPSPPYSPSGYDSPPNEYSYGSGLPYYSQPHFPRARNVSSASYYGAYGPPMASRSPVSAGSSTAYMPQWGSNAQSPAPLHYSSSSSSERMYCAAMPNLFSEQHYIQVVINGSLRTVTAEQRDNMETGDLLIPTAIPQNLPSDLAFDEIAFTNEQRYLAAYWTWLHPLYPVVHKPTFTLAGASPLLRAAMLALGAHMLQTSVDMENARMVHERCTKILKRRNIDGSHTFRVCDMQAILLIEIYSIFKARRPPLQFSKIYLEVYSRLAGDHQALSQDTANWLHDNPMQTNDFMEESYEGAFGNLDAKCRQRLLIACYILDQQHATLFGRLRTTCMVVPGMNLPFARSQDYWDAPPEQQLEIRYQRQSAGIPCYDQVFQAMSALPSMTETAEEPHDTFRSSLMLACFADPNNDLEAYGCAPDSDMVPSNILLAIEQSPCMRLAFHTHMLCKYTPMRDLLCVAGESWCMAEKLSSLEEYSRAQKVALDWAKGTITEPGSDTASVQRALYHARQILDIHRKHPKTGLLYHEWAIYLAAVVFWARAYCCPRRRPRLSIPSPTEPRKSMHELEKTVSVLIDGETTMITWNEAASVLLWTKTQIDKVNVPHNCGLTNGALDVLGRLATRGNEGSLFGE